MMPQKNVKPPLISVKNAVPNLNGKNCKQIAAEQSNEETLANFITFYNSKSRHEYNYNIEEGSDSNNAKEEPVQDQAAIQSDRKINGDYKKVISIQPKELDDIELDLKVPTKKLFSPVYLFTKKEHKKPQLIQIDRECETRQANRKPLISQADDAEIIPQAVHCDKLYIIKAHNLISYHYGKDTNTIQPMVQLPQIISKKDMHRQCNEFDTLGRNIPYKEKVLK